MVEYVTRDEFEARVGVLEQEVEGEKLVTRHILEQTRHNGDDISAIKTRLERVETQIGDVRSQLGNLTSAFRGFQKDFPSIVAKVMREVLGERKT